VKDVFASWLAKKLAPRVQTCRSDSSPPIASLH